MTYKYSFYPCITRDKLRCSTQRVNLTKILAVQQVLSLKPSTPESTYNLRNAGKRARQAISCTAKHQRKQKQTPNQSSNSRSM